MQKPAARQTLRQFRSVVPSLASAIALRKGHDRIIAAGAYVAFCLLWQVFRWGGDEYKTLIGDTLILPLELLAIWLGAQTARSTALSAPLRRAWQIIAVAFVADFLGNLLYFVLESILGVEPFPSVADVSYLAFYPLMLWGVLLFPRVTRFREEVARYWLDATIVLVAGAIVLWQFVLRPPSENDGTDLLSLWLGIAYVAGDLVVLLAIAVILLQRPNPATRASLYLVAAGLLGFFTADVAFAYLTRSNAYAGGDWPDAFWILGVYGMAVAAHVQRWHAEHLSDERVSQEYPQSPFGILPHLMGVAVYTLVLWMVSMSDSGPVREVVLGGIVMTALTVARQIAAAKEHGRVIAELASLRSEARFRSLVQNLSDMIAICSIDGTLAYCSPSLVRVIGAEFIAQDRPSLLNAVHLSDYPRVSAYLMDVAAGTGVAPPIEFRLLSSDGQWIDAQAVGSNLINDANVQGIVLTIRDIAERRILEAQLAHQALHDTLTGLANRLLFHDRVEHALVRSARSLESPAVLYVDVDNFKSINDTFGHDQGDLLLQTIARRLQSGLRAGDTAARLGGDEFGLLLESVRTVDDATAAAERLLQTLRKPIKLRGRDVVVPMSIGVAIPRASGDEADDLLRNADIAMYSAKEHGKDRFEVFAPDMRELAADRGTGLLDLQGALDRGEFRLHYQPIVSLETQELAGVEAVVRWEHPERGLILPSDFLALAEDTGLIVPIGQWVLGEACRQIREWHHMLPNDGRGLPFISVNLSERQVDDMHLADHVTQALFRARLSPRFLTLEITETLLMQRIEVNLRSIQRLGDLGLALAVDHFGTGYSPLSYLRHFPVQILKIDKSFIDSIEDDAGAETLVRAIVSLVRDLHLQIVAQGIETEGQLQRLREIGCHMGQGFLFGRPVTAEELTARLANRPPSLARRVDLRISA